MKWKIPNINDIKIKRKFALFPIKINNEVRWLEWVVVKYRYDYNEDTWLYSWMPIEFIDKDNK